jgi:hypothetical protein
MGLLKQSVPALVCAFLSGGCSEGALIGVNGRHHASGTYESKGERDGADAIANGQGDEAATELKLEQRQAAAPRLFVELGFDQATAAVRVEESYLRMSDARPYAASGGEYRVVLKTEAGATAWETSISLQTLSCQPPTSDHATAAAAKPAASGHYVLILPEDQAAPARKLEIFDKAGQTALSAVLTPRSDLEAPSSYLEATPAGSEPTGGGLRLAGDGAMSVAFVGHAFADEPAFAAQAQRFIGILKAKAPFDRLTAEGHMRFFVVPGGTRDLGCAHVGGDGGRAITCDAASVLGAVAAAGAPADQIIVLMNRDEYLNGFADGTYVTVSALNTWAPYTIAHEFGHALGLQDEYVYETEDFAHAIGMWGTNCIESASLTKVGGITFTPQPGCASKAWHSTSPKSLMHGFDPSDPATINFNAVSLHYLNERVMKCATSAVCPRGADSDQIAARRQEERAAAAPQTMPGAQPPQPPPRDPDVAPPVVTSLTRDFNANGQPTVHWTIDAPTGTSCVLRRQIWGADIADIGAIGHTGDYAENLWPLPNASRTYFIDCDNAGGEGHGQVVVDVQDTARLAARPIYWAANKYGWNKYGWRWPNWDWANAASTPSQDFGGPGREGTPFKALVPVGNEEACGAQTEAFHETATWHDAPLSGHVFDYAPAGQAPAGWADKGVAFCLIKWPWPGTVALHKLIDQSYGSRIYTLDGTWRPTGYQYIGVVGYVYPP